MGLISYIQNIPASGNDPSADQPNMFINTNSLFNYLSVDHIPFNVNNSGYHKVIHMTTQTLDPVTTATFGQLYTKSVTINAIIDNQLFYKTGLGTISQLTGGNQVANGYQYIGGILMQWGVKLAPGSSGSVVFPTPFPAACFNVSITQRRDGSNSTQGMYINGIPSQSGFNYNGSSSSDEAIYWIAIGN